MASDGAISSNYVGSQLRIHKVCVIGAGTMGAGIAAHLANLGFSVTLLDATQQLVTEGLERARTAHPSPFYIPEKANEIRLGNTVEHLRLATEADWICEAVVERAEIKRSIYASLDPLLSPDTIVTTNTSGLEIAQLAEGLSDRFRSRFLGAHFFNPPRYLKLLELIPTAQNSPEFVQQMRMFLESRVARRVVIAKDTPGFIANRYGMWCMFHAVHVAEKLRLSVEEVDAITGPFLGRPTSASFRLNDLVGIDVMRDIAANLLERCSHDPHIATLQMPTTLEGLLARGWLGQKVGQGYYRKEGNEYLVLELQNFAYRQSREVDLPALAEASMFPLGERIAKILGSRDQAGEFLRLYLVPCLRYAEYLREEVCHSVLDFDRVMEWGFGWQMGPFRMIDAIGHDVLGIPGEPYFKDHEQRAFNGHFVSIPKETQYQPLSDYPVVSKGEKFLLRDLGDGVTAVSFTTKMGSIHPELVDELIELFEAKKIERYVLTSEAKAYSVGYDLNFFADAISESRPLDIERALIRLGYLGSLLEKTPGVAAIKGFGLGAGLELALSCQLIVADAEAKIGLPESRVGLIPGGRGVALTRLNNQFSAKRLCEVGYNLICGVMSQNAEQARGLGYLRPTDITSYHPDRLILTAKEAALKARPLVHPTWTIAEGPLGGMLDRQMDLARQKGELSEHDVLIGNEIKNIYAKATNFDDAVARERARFLDLCTKSLTVTRIKHMLEHNKPLRN